MNQDSKLQIPVTNKLKNGLKKRAEEYGFSSVNEAVRLLIQNFVNGNISIQFTQGPKTISMIDLESEIRMLENLEDIKRGDCDLIDFQKDRDALKKLIK